MRNQLVEQHPIRRLLRQALLAPGIPEDDLRQIALLAIVHAVERFDPEVGVAFSTFASRTIDGELKRYFRDRTWSVRPPRQAQELHLELRRTDEELTHRLGRSPTMAELADEVGESEDHVLEALEAGVAHRPRASTGPRATTRRRGARRSHPRRR